MLLFQFWDIFSLNSLKVKGKYSLTPTEWSCENQWVSHCLSASTISGRYHRIHIYKHRNTLIPGFVKKKKKKSGGKCPTRLKFAGREMRRRPKMAKWRDCPHMYEAESTWFCK